MRVGEVRDKFITLFRLDRFMAGANLPAKKYSKKTPTVTRLSFEMTGGATQYIDVAKALSIINRRFYRQGLYYYVNSVEVYNNETGVIDLHTIPDTWVAKNAWARAFKLYQKMNNLVGPPLSNGIMPAYHDFKVFMSELHRTTGSENPDMYGINAAFTSNAPDEWTYSVFTSADDDQDALPNADEFAGHMIGGHTGTSANWQSIGLIKSYAKSRATVPADSPTLDETNLPIDPLLSIFDFSSEEQFNDILENLSEFNDEPPYDSDGYIGESANHMQHVARIGTEVGIGRVGRASGFCAPIGLICVDPHGVSTAFRVVLNLAVGTYHGVYAERF
jgi:hypothetical protein